MDDDLLRPLLVVTAESSAETALALTCPRCKDRHVQLRRLHLVTVEQDSYLRRERLRLDAVTGRLDRESLADSSPREGWNRGPVVALDLECESGGCRTRVELRAHKGETFAEVLDMSAHSAD